MKKKIRMRITQATARTTANITSAFFEGFFSKAGLLVDPYPLRRPLRNARFPAGAAGPSSS